MGPGPVLAAAPCGEILPAAGALAARVAWEPVGEPLRTPAATTLTSTYDLSGAAWFLVQFADQARTADVRVRWPSGWRAANGRAAAS